MTRVKVCGVTSERDLSLAVDAGADAVGFIADVPVETPREVDSGTAADLVAAAPPRPVGIAPVRPPPHFAK
jgi:phosphoribosylanthranilate isomerase